MQKLRFYSIFFVCTIGSASLVHAHAENENEVCGSVLAEDTRPFGEQLWAHHNILLRQAMRLAGGNRALAEDLVQGTMVKALKSQNKFISGTNLKAWLSTILRNHAISYWRSRHVEREFLLDDSLEGTASEGDAYWFLLAKDVARLIDRLPPEQKFALEALVLKNMSFEDIADTSGVGVPTAKTRVFSARRFIEAKMMGEDQRPSKRAPKKRSRL